MVELESRSPAEAAARELRADLLHLRRDIIQGLGL